MIRQVFVDSDVIISSLLSDKGAAFLLLHSQPSLTRFFITQYSIDELEIVVQRLEISNKNLTQLVDTRLETVHIPTSQERIQKTYERYVIDTGDAHIVGGAAETKCRFLLTYNVKHFRTEKIKEKFNILIMTPAMFLQYIRSLQ
ncbi:hypothetical protein A2875_05160 [Candidatus Gottesmanbacteria bacterium RIFCSPHIGHO2_01_FULL_46_14]|uniref:PIN domain-containing protein n=2 Tax=Candidatus Gottesmaniibacteriota TaxID=1752720 RepID=A0A1F5ZRK1_9BACT|nr:MAG: hypothetical protein A2875_05160 [Candidatus Gottesmanbacteria bacterium RIFCSPHIGHO2_01_FULL_46_14]OGG29976.1 MAG: hypothetical protein A2971_04455 [Candidatus Gottesmanbacteria bacterium RIFCSPLOWO2_01_FULL_46_21]